MQVNEHEDNWGFLCRECPAGKLQPRNIVYITWLGEDLITVPDFPAWVCDFCGRRIYDEEALRRLNLLLNPGVGRREKPYQPRPSQPELKPPRPAA